MVALEMEWRGSIIPDYEVSEYGDLRLLKNKSNLLAGKILKGWIKKGGYREYQLNVDGISIHFYAHRLVLAAFIGPQPTPQHQCAHWDGNPSNNHYTNLRWATPAENSADRVRHGRHLTGHRKFTAEEVLDMRELGNSGKSYSYIRQKYKVSMGNLSAIINRDTWKHI
jgi:hypothetical protein